ncbi:hypothetical protein FSP39_011083 [Pinctada imbricata]|uniref:Tyr recombinase domain-containing protein n=2 Tax=Pinctada imbricata TaxID=66713 RepID=A0AA88YB89_PINIB|nr:hypothetical protein FSP39_011083 [Pinctada imbricata]
MAADDNKRFCTLNESDFQKLIESRDAANTKRATTHAVKTFRAYLNEKRKSIDFEDFSTEELDNELSRFYVEARKENGELYKKSTLLALRHGISRHMQACSGIDIINDKAFTKSKTSFLAASKELKREGKGGIDHYPPIDSDDLKKMYLYFDLDNNVKLQEKVFVDIVLYFGRRGRENIHLLKLSDFSAKRDGEGNLYIYMDKDELTKNHQDDPNSAEGRMYQLIDDPMCPVRSFMKYKRLLNPDCNRLFQRPSRGSTKWYDNVPLGHNSIAGMMPNISERAGLSIRYTNHSLRATAVHILDADGKFSSRHIMSVTGHKSENSLKTYTGYTDPKIKRKMSETISSNLRRDQETCETASSTTVHTESPLLDMTMMEFEPLTDAQFNSLIADMDFDSNMCAQDENVQISRGSNSQNVGNQVLPVNKRSAPLMAHANTCNTLNIQTNNQHLAQYPQQSLLMPQLHNCSNITINYNFK